MWSIPCHGALSVGHTQVQIPWTLVHGQLSVCHTWQLTRWTIVHGALSVGHTRVDTMDYSPWSTFH